MVTRLVGVDSVNRRLPATVITASQGTTAADLAPGNIGATTLASANAHADAGDATIASSLAATNDTVTANTAETRNARPVLFFPVGGTAGLTTRHIAALDGATALDIRWIEYGLAAPAATINVLSQWNSTGNNRQVLIQRTATGAGQIAVSGDGVTGPGGAVAPVVAPPAGQIRTNRVTWDGPSNVVTWSQKTTATVAGMASNASWSTLATTALTTAVAALFNAPTATFQIMGTSGGGGPGPFGVLAMQAAVSIGGTPVVSWRAEPRDLALLDPFGNQWRPFGAEQVRWIDGAGQQLATPAPPDLIGTGAPEGVIAAPIATRYRDTAATNGAIEWLKASGAASSTIGWRPVSADTGWRTILAWDAAGAFTTGTGFGDANLVPRTGQAGWIRVRRVNNRCVAAGINVQADADGIALGVSAVVTAMPTGFAPTNTESAKRVGQVGNINAHYQVTSASLFLVMFAAITANAILLNSPPTTIDWTTDQAWPATLPGIAAP